MRPLTMATTVHNEAARILGLLDHAIGYCDELVVVDQSSTDGTADLARDFGATVLTDVHHGHAEPSRELMVGACKTPWVLNLDADEIIDPEHVEEIVGFPARTGIATFGRVSYVDGVRVTEHPDPCTRYFRKDLVDLCPRVHSRIVLNAAMRAYTEQFYTEEPWIIHTKSQAEWDIDQARYEALGAVA